MIGDLVLLAMALLAAGAFAFVFIDKEPSDELLLAEERARRNAICTPSHESLKDRLASALGLPESTVSFSLRATEFGDVEVRCSYIIPFSEHKIDRLRHAMFDYAPKEMTQ